MVKHILAAIALISMTATASAEPPAAPPLDEARVTLPYAELRRLLDISVDKQLAPIAKPPVEATLLAARYQLALDAGQASGSVEYDIQSFTDSWIVLPLIGVEAQIEEVEPADVQLIVRDRQFAVVTNRPGRQKIRLKFANKMALSADGLHLNVPVSPASINTLAVTSVPSGQTVRVPGATPIAGPGGRVSFRLPAQDHLVLDVVSDKPIAPPVASRWTLETQAVVELSDGKLNYTAHVAANTDRGSGVAIDLRLPAGVNVTAVTGEDVAEWKINPGENETRVIHVQWQTRDILRRELELLYNYPQPLLAAQWILQAPAVEEGEATPPLFIVLPEQGLELSSTSPASAPRQLPKWLTERVKGRNYLVFAGQSTLAARWLPLVETAQAVVETQHSAMRLVADGALLNEATYVIRHETGVRWQVELPEGAELLSSAVDGHTLNPSDRGERVLEFSLPGSKPLTTVTFSYTAKKPAFKPVSGQFTVELPKTDLLINDIDWELRIPGAYEIAAFEGNVESAPGCSAKEEGACLVRLHKELCKKEQPRAEFFYQKKEPNK